MNKIIVQISHDFFPDNKWGVASHVDLLSDNLSSAGYKIILFTKNFFNYKSGKYKNINLFRSDNFIDYNLIFNKYSANDQYVDFDLLMAWNLIFAKQAVSYLLKNKQKPLIIHNHTWMTHLLSARLADYFQIPLVSSVHFFENGANYLGYNPVDIDTIDILKLEKNMILKSAKVILFSKNSLKKVRMTFPSELRKKFCIIPHSLNLKKIKKEREKWSKLKDDSQVKIIFVGRLIPSKGIIDFLEVGLEILNIFPKTIIYIIGFGALYTDLVKKYSSEKIIFTSHLNNSSVYKHYATSDIFVSPSYSETFGLSVIEALSFGLSVISTCGETVPRVFDKKSGITVNIEKKNNKLYIDRSQLKEAIVGLIASNLKRETLKKNALNYSINKYDCKDMTNATIKMYNELIHKKLN